MKSFFLKHYIQDTNSGFLALEVMLLPTLCPALLPSTYNADDAQNVVCIYFVKNF